MSRYKKLQIDRDKADQNLQADCQITWYMQEAMIERMIEQMKIDRRSSVKVFEYKRPAYSRYIADKLIAKGHEAEVGYRGGTWRVTVISPDARRCRFLCFDCV